MTATGWRTLLAWAGAGLVLGWVVARFVYVARGEVASVPGPRPSCWRSRASPSSSPRSGRARASSARRGPSLCRLWSALGSPRSGVAASRVGAGVGGGYAGYAVFLLGDLTTDYRKQVVLRCAFCVLGAVVLVVGALLLERVLRLPEDSDEAHITT